MFLYKKIKDARIEKNFTQKKLAEELTKLGKKTSNTAIANWEAGLNSPDIDTLSLICNILGKDGNYFFENRNYTTLIDTTDLTENEIQELENYKEFIKSKRKNKRGENSETKNC